MCRPALLLRRHAATRGRASRSPTRTTARCESGFSAGQFGQCAPSAMICLALRRIILDLSVTRIRWRQSCAAFPPEPGKPGIVGAGQAASAGLLLRFFCVPAMTAFRTGALRFRIRASCRWHCSGRVALALLVRLPDHRNERGRVDTVPACCPRGGPTRARSRSRSATMGSAGHKILGLARFLSRRASLAMTDSQGIMPSHFSCASYSSRISLDASLARRPKGPTSSCTSLSARLRDSLRRHMSWAGCCKPSLLTPDLPRSRMLMFSRAHAGRTAGARPSIA